MRLHDSGPLEGEKSREAHSAILDYVAWARQLTLADAYIQIASYAKEYWIIQLWDANYRAHRTI
ncbi:hypothetical protein OKW46_001311 [Paraburkholderia sp. WSM4179]|nr:hypothetical protein [Paraburkholderia sp. WSM4179]